MTDFAGRHVVVTGGAGALGVTVVETLLAAGAVVYAVDRAPGAGARLERLRGPTLHVTTGVDLAEEGAVTRFYGSLPPLWGSIQIAGGFAMHPIAETPAAEFDGLLAMNARSTFLCCREAIRAIRRGPTGGREGRGRLVNVAAMPALEPRRGAGMVAYTASKAAVAALTVALAEEVAAEGIWVNGVAPGTMDTPANRAAMPDAETSGWVQLGEVAATIVFLAAPANGATRGAIVACNGRG